MKILIAEDDETNRKVIERTLRKFGTCVEAKDGSEAIALFESARNENAPFDLLCLDIMMPEVSGHEVLQKIRGIEEAAGVPAPKGTKVIMVTALGDAKNVLAAFREGCECYLTKPLDRSKLIESLEKLGFQSPQ